MIASLQRYIAQDRRRALARGEPLPDRTTGAALFADISGFTPLTERLRESLGHRRGAEELTHYLDTIYSALMAEVERYQGSVVGFAGDAMLCWFDESAGQASERAVACALALQKAMQSFGDLALKVAVTTGSARRFVVGDLQIYRMDTLAGATITRTATAEHLAHKGEILVDTATAEALGADLQVSEWRTDAESGERFAVIAATQLNLQPSPILETDEGLTTELLRPWLHHAVYEREISGQGSFLTELRPTVVLFVRFIGIDYDGADAEAQLDQFVRHSQAIVTRHEGTFLQIAIGDKGSYALIAFGALTVHEDDARRATLAALELRAMSAKLPFLQPLQMGLTQGVTRVGVYGGQTRHTYSVIGDEVNLAARLMEAASPGEILISGRAHKLVASTFIFEPHPPLLLKGKAEPQLAFAVRETRQTRAIHLQEPDYALPMVGRQTELQIISEKLDLAWQGQAQMVGIVAEAGMGKSRLVAEVIRLARGKGFVGYGGACQSDAINTPYLVWKPIWSAFFGIDPELPLAQQLQVLTDKITTYAPERVQAMPLLKFVLDLAIPDNEFTQTLEPKFRQSALQALLEDGLKAATREMPRLLVIEDMHWIDALSFDLLEGVARAMTAFPLCIVLAYRPPQLLRLQTTRLEGLTNFSKIALTELNPIEGEQAIRAKLAHLYPAHTAKVPPLLVEKLMARAQGNPFYLEELLNYLHDRGLDPYACPPESGEVELPDSLHALILSRLDYLTEHAKTTLRVASIIGRLFRASWLMGYYPTLGDAAQVKADLQELHTLDITPLDTPEPELAYLFKHIITHEVTYESLPFATRAQLHEQLAHYLETEIATDAASLAALVDTVAYHYGQSNNTAKQRDYFQKAATVAKASYANETALGYYARLLPLLTDPQEQMELHLEWGEVLTLIGRFAEADTHYHEALTRAMPDIRNIARCQFALGVLHRDYRDFAKAIKWFEQAQANWTTLNDRKGLAETWIALSWALFWEGQGEEAWQYFEKSLAIAQELNDHLIMADAYNGLGVVKQHFYRGTTDDHYGTVRELCEKSIEMYRQVGTKWAMVEALDALERIETELGNYKRACELEEQRLVILQEMGNKQSIAWTLNTIGFVLMQLGEYASAKASYEQSLALCYEVDNMGLRAIVCRGLGLVACRQRDYFTAQRLNEESLQITRHLNDKLGIAWSWHDLGNVAYYQKDYMAMKRLHRESLSINSEMGYSKGTVFNLIGLARGQCHQGSFEPAVRLLAQVETVCQTVNFTIETIQRPIYDEAKEMARVALGEVAFNAAWSAGQAMTLAEAVSLALEQG